MSTQEGKRLRELFTSTLTRVTLCPYCGRETTGPCCGEVHATEYWLDEKGDHFSDYDFPARFAAWLAAREDREPDAPDPMTLAKNYGED